MTWQGRHVLVTGGTRGIGRELVLLLVARGARVTATGTTPQGVAEAAAACPGVRWLALDQRRPDDRERLARTLLVDDLSDVIHNAGVQQLRDFTGPGDDEALSVQDEVDINLVGVVDLTRRLLPALRRTAAAAGSAAGLSIRPSLVFVTSGLALAPKRSSPVYCATKAGLRSFAKALRAQLRTAEGGIRVVEALPPIVDTDMTRGRGARKLPAAEAARQILAGLDTGRDEVFVGASALLKWVLRLSPALGERIMIDR
jgi:uncharacterized oxidoreductase